MVLKRQMPYKRERQVRDDLRQQDISILGGRWFSFDSVVIFVDTKVGRIDMKYGPAQEILDIFH